MIGDSYIINISQRVQEGGSPGSGCPVNNQSDKVLLPHFIQKGSRGGVCEADISFIQKTREGIFICSCFLGFFFNIVFIGQGLSKRKKKQKKKISIQSNIV